jgi:hypothetical protein
MKRLIVGCSVAFLTACGQGGGGPGVSASSSNENSTDSKSVLSRVKDMMVGHSAKATIQMPAAGLVADAMREFLVATEMKLSIIHDMLIFFPSLKRASDPYGLAKRAAADLKLNEITPDAWKAQAENFAKELATPNLRPGIHLVISEKRKCFALGQAGDLAKATECYRVFFLRQFTAMAIATSNEALIGWPVSPMRDRAMANDWISGMSVLVEYSNLVGTELVSSLQGKSLRDPDAATLAILQALFALPAEKLEAMSEAAIANADKSMRNATIDLASGRGITWTSPNGQYKNMGAGWQLVRNGMIWYGEGKMSGKSYDLALESTVSANFSKKKSIDASEAQAAKDINKADVGVK